MKIVINKCFGGFALSMKATARVAELLEMPCYFFDHKDNPINIGAKEGIFTRAFNTPEKPNQEGWQEMTPDEKKMSNKAYEEASIPDFRASEDRTNPILVQVVEELGEEASGRFSKLVVVEIPNDVEWEIDDYDGNETVEEAHRSWS